MDKNTIIQKLTALRAESLEIKGRGLDFSQTAEFQVWKEKVMKWLRLGLPHTEYELQSIKRLFASLYVTDDEDDDGEDRRQYEKDCDLAAHLLESAVENLKLGLMPGIPEKKIGPSSPKESRATRRVDGVSIGQAGTVVLGNRNVVTIADSITISDFMNALEREIRTKVTNPVEQRGLIDRVKALSGNPTVAQILGQTLGQFLRTTFGG